MKNNKEIPIALDEKLILMHKQKQTEMILDVNSPVRYSSTVDTVIEKMENQIIATLDSLREFQSFNDDKI